MIESRLSAQQLKDYRRWKLDLRVRANHARQLLTKALAERSPRRLFDRDFRPIFVGGMSGSGTTLLVALLNQTYESRLYLMASDKTPETGRLLYRENSAHYSGYAEYVQDLYAPLRVSPRRMRAAVLGHYRRAATYPYESATVFDKSTNSRLVRFGLLREAFPHAGAVLLYRNPAYVIEGLRRKWPHLYSELSIEELSDYWIELHEFFLAHNRVDEETFLFSYRAFLDHSEEIISRIGKAYQLQHRITPLDYADKANQRGKGLRNVLGGRIEIVKKIKPLSREWVSAKEEKRIRARTQDTFNRLEDHSRFPLGR